MKQVHTKSIDRKINNSQLKPNYSSFGQLVTQAVKESTDLTSNGRLLIAAGETNASLLEPSTPASSGYAAEGLLHPLKETQLPEGQNDSTTISPAREKQLLTMQTASSQNLQLGCPKESQSDYSSLKALKSEPFFTRYFTSPLSLLLGEEERLYTAARTTQLREWQKQGRSKTFVLFWDGIYLLDLLLRYVASRVEAFTSVIKLIDIDIK